VTVGVVWLRQEPTSRGPTLPTSADIGGLVSYQFISPQVGWVHLETGTDVIAKTLDGGRTWHPQLSVSDLAPAPTMQWINGQIGVLIGQSASSAVIWRTNDGGTTWHSNRLSVSPSGQPGHWVVLTGYFLDAQDGWLLFGRDYGGCGGCFGPWEGALYGSTDGGNHWNKLGTVPPSLNAYWPRIKFFNSSLATVSNGSDPSNTPIM
jgi:photosystem II stability/assembly factor-like uncharacterized protein